MKAKLLFRPDFVKEVKYSSCLNLCKIYLTMFNKKLNTKFIKSYNVLQIGKIIRRDIDADKYWKSKRKCLKRIQLDTTEFLYLCLILTAYQPV